MMMMDFGWRSPPCLLYWVWGVLANGVVTCCLPLISGFPLVSFAPIYMGLPASPANGGGDTLFAPRMPNVGRYTLSGVVIPLEIV